MTSLLKKKASTEICFSTLTFVRCGNPYPPSHPSPIKENCKIRGKTTLISINRLKSYIHYLQSKMIL